MSFELPYFDLLLKRLDQHHPAFELAFGRHVHWGYWEDPARATHTAQDYAQAAESLSREIYSAAQVADGHHILDVGCGFGGTIASLNENFSKLHLLGVNIDERQLDRARATVKARPGNRIDFRHGDACALRVADSSMDRVLAVECIFHFADRWQFFAEVSRVLKPGGYLALSDFVPQIWYAPLAKLGTSTPIMTKFFGRCSLCTLNGYRKLALATGLQLVLERDITANTMPTYGFMRAFATQLGSSAAGSGNLATRSMELTSRSGALRYRILALRKPL